ncbi:hypothetical protein TNCV_172691 [Trichonephila clavipes]|nr:hypothetical protein TNCV_172691 [Trichonephila clavipes]
MALYRSPLTVTLWPSSFLKKYGTMIPPAHKALQTSISSAIDSFTSVLLNLFIDADRSTVDNFTAARRVGSTCNAIFEVGSDFMTEDHSNEENINREKTIISGATNTGHSYTPFKPFVNRKTKPIPLDEPSLPKKKNLTISSSLPTQQKPEEPNRSGRVRRRGSRR